MKYAGIRFLALWILANGLGWFSFMLVFIVPMVGRVARYAVPWSSALILGVLQWAVLNGPLGVNWRWPMAAMLAYAPLYYIVAIVSEASAMICLGLLVLGVLGLPQFAVLNEYVDHARLWIFLSPIAVALALVFSMSAASAASRGMLIKVLVTYVDNTYSLGGFWAWTGLAYGLVTGLGLVWMARSPNAVEAKG